MLLGSLAIVAVCLLVALEVTDEMGWEGRGAKRAVFGGLVLLIFVIGLALESAWLRYERGPREQVTPRHAAPMKDDLGRAMRLYDRAKHRLFRSSLH